MKPLSWHFLLCPPPKEYNHSLNAYNPGNFHVMKASLLKADVIFAGDASSGWWTLPMDIVFVMFIYFV